MANSCEYHVIVKGKRNNCYAFYGSMSALDYKEIDWEEGTDNNYEMKFSGNCKWSVDSYCSDKYEGPFPAFIPEDYLEAEDYAEDHYWYNTVELRSKMFDVEVKCNSADIEYDPENIENYYEHWKSGEKLGGKCPDELYIESIIWED